MRINGDQIANIRLYRRINLSILGIVDRVSKHHSLQQQGAERLPVLAMHAVMTLLTREAERYRGWTLLPLAYQHTDADRREALVGDVHIRNSTGLFSEGYEIKHNTPITSGLIQASSEKLQATTISRFYMLTTYQKENYSEFEPEIRHMEIAHRRELILDSFDRTLTYYLRLLKDTSYFVDRYASNLETDPYVTFQLKQAWNELVQG